jgi:hypothetical protein
MATLKQAAHSQQTNEDNKHIANDHNSVSTDKEEDATTIHGKCTYPTCSPFRDCRGSQTAVTAILLITGCRPSGAPPRARFPRTKTAAVGRPSTRTSNQRAGTVRLHVCMRLVRYFSSLCWPMAITFPSQPLSTPRSRISTCTVSGRVVNSVDLTNRHAPQLSPM